MAGIYLLSKKTSQNNIKKIYSRLKLPRWVNGSSDTKPEYFFGFYKGSCGLDIGICFENGQFRLFHGSLADTCYPQYDSGNLILSGVNPEDIIDMDAKIERNGVKLTVKKGNRTWTLTAPFRNQAVKNTFRNGATVNREMTVATNLTGQINPVDIYSYNAQFIRGTYYDMNGNSYSTSSLLVTHILDIEGGAIDNIENLKFAQVDSLYDIASVDLGSR